jgi:hypothetical protein
MKLVAVAISAALFLSGCAEYEQRMAADRAAAADGECRSYGFAVGTEGYANCRMNATNRDNSNRAAAFQAWQSQQRSFQQNQPPPYMMPTNRSVNTTCQNYGTTTNCQSQ